jgi:hypothetical protein
MTVRSIATRTVALVAAIAAAAAQTPSASPAAICNIRTPIGNRTGEFAGDGGQAAFAGFSHVRHIAIQADRLYIAEEGSKRVRLVNLTSGIITTVGGNGNDPGTFIGTSPTSAAIGAVATVAVLDNGDPLVGVGSACSVVALASTTYRFAGNGTCLSAGNVAISGAVATSTGFAVPLTMTVWNGGVFISTGTWGDGGGWGGGGGGGGVRDGDIVDSAAVLRPIGCRPAALYRHAPRSLPLLRRPHVMAHR